MRTNLAHRAGGYFVDRQIVFRMLSKLVKFPSSSAVLISYHRVVALVSGQLRKKLPVFL